MNVTNFGAFTPSAGQVFNVLTTGGSLSGTFATVNFPFGTQANTTYTANTVRLDIIGALTVNQWTSDIDGLWSDAPLRRRAHHSARCIDTSTDHSFA